MNDIAVIGDRDTVLAFALGGIEGYVVADADGARQALERARRSNVDAPTKLVLVTQTVADLLGGLAELDGAPSSLPLVLEIPGFGEGEKRRSLQQLLTRVLRIGR